MLKVFCEKERIERSGYFDVSRHNNSIGCRVVVGSGLVFGLLSTKPKKVRPLGFLTFCGSTMNTLMDLLLSLS